MVIPTADDVVAGVVDAQVEKLRRKAAIVRVFHQLHREQPGNTWAAALCPVLLRDDVRKDVTVPQSDERPPTAVHLLQDAIRGVGTAKLGGDQSGVYVEARTNAVAGSESPRTAATHHPLELLEKMDLQQGDTAGADSMTPAQWNHVRALQMSARRSKWAPDVEASETESGQQHAHVSDPRVGWYDCLVLRPHAALSRVRSFVLCGTCEGSPASLQPSWSQASTHDDERGVGDGEEASRHEAEQVVSSSRVLAPGLVSVSGSYASSSLGRAIASVRGDSAAPTGMWISPQDEMKALAQLPGSVVVGVWQSRPVCITPAACMSRAEVRRLALSEPFNSRRTAESMLGVGSVSHTRGKVMHVPGAGVVGSSLQSSTRSLPPLASRRRHLSTGSSHGARPGSGALADASTASSMVERGMHEGGRDAVGSASFPSWDLSGAASRGSLRAHRDESRSTAHRQRSEFTVFPPGVNPAAVLSTHALLYALALPPTLHVCVAPALSKCLQERAVGGLSTSGGAVALVDRAVPGVVKSGGGTLAAAGGTSRRVGDPLGRSRSRGSGSADELQGDSWVGEAMSHPLQALNVFEQARARSLAGTMGGSRAAAGVNPLMKTSIASLQSTDVAQAPRGPPKPETPDGADAGAASQCLYPMPPLPVNGSTASVPGSVSQVVLDEDGAQMCVGVGVAALGRDLT